MSRYLIIDTRFLNESSEPVETLKRFGFILSEEETLSKFKEVFEAGCKFGAMDSCNWFPEEGWNEEKKTL